MVKLRYSEPTNEIGLVIIATSIGAVALRAAVGTRPQYRLIRRLADAYVVAVLIVLLLLVARSILAEAGNGR